MAQLFGFPYVYASSRTWPQVQAAGFDGMIEEIAQNQAATADPTVAPTATATGGGSTGGLLAAGTYYIVYTESNGLGETKISPQSAQLTVAAGNIPRVTFPALQTNNSARHLYLGAVNGPSGGPYRRYASYITTTTHDCATAMPASSDAVPAPTANATAPDRQALQLLRSIKQRRYGEVFRYVDSAMTNFQSGVSTDWRQTMMAIQRAQWVFRAGERVCSYIGEMARANPGTIGYTTDAVGHAVARRTWP